ncbi:acetoacetate--CoA ligase [Oceanobacillus piezotolerans]|uniref:Acetoacetate--CoA ligase n=1 Tax=Oceanobacillus piezotolerans TaxID=2448030 RepID=A0A498DDY1_9BACI|nr:acetoacetate--CoA ligase [Oceanobacillus piezotolerans]RLL46870.1 acetoacetate--CoA ligase [Oceanobacillus piezotolerans]
MAETEGQIIWEPTKEWKEKTVLRKYMKWLQENKGLDFHSYNELWKWSVYDLENFWESIWKYCDIQCNQSYSNVLSERNMPGSEWFSGSMLNYTENIFSNFQENKRAIFFRSETVEKREYTWKELKEQVASVAFHLRKLGVNKGDRVVSYMPNIPEAVIALLATASIGAIWSSCSPDFGLTSVIDRFKQIEPVVLFAVDGYQYNGKTYDRTSVVSKLQSELSTIKYTIHVPYLNKDKKEELTNTISWDSIVKDQVLLQYESVPFNHPLWVVYSSGTTGMPKPIVQGHGGIILEHKKTMTIQNNLTPNDTAYWFTSTGWVMWNMLVGSLFSGAGIVLYDGSPSYPDINTLWKLAEDAEITSFGTSAPYLVNCMKMNLEPGKNYDLSTLKSIVSTGAPLTSETFKWVYKNVKRDIWLCSSSGGTDVNTGFVGGVSIDPVKIGKIQGRLLGVHAESFDEDGNVLTNEVGELVITKPMPSMPLYFWNDKENKRYEESYFDTYPGIWKHGDWIKIDEEGSCIIYGRSDSTINRSGVRIGTSDIYRVIEGLVEIVEGLAIDLEVIGRSNSLIYFVVLKQGQLDYELKNKIREEIRMNLSPRFMPDEIYQVEQIPKTLNGKKLEVPIRKMLLGFDFNKVINPDSMQNPESLEPFKELARDMKYKSTNLFK